MNEYQDINSESFAQTLKKARESSGFDVETVARRLHIRADILEAIESADFDRMPASGYTRNMVRAYARTVGLNQNEICNRYFQELEEHLGNEASDRDLTFNNYSKSSRTARYHEHSNLNGSRSSGSRRTSTRVSFLDLDNSDRKQANKPRRKDTHDRQVKKSVPVLSSIPHPSLNFDPKSLDIKKVIIAVIALIVVIALVIFINGIISSHNQATEDVPAMPISGLTDTTTDSTS